MDLKQSMGYRQQSENEKYTFLILFFSYTYTHTWAKLTISSRSSTLFLKTILLT